MISQYQISSLQYRRRSATALYDWGRGVEIMCCGSSCSLLKYLDREKRYCLEHRNIAYVFSWWRYLFIFAEKLKNISACSVWLTVVKWPDWYDSSSYVKRHFGANLISISRGLQWVARCRTTLNIKLFGG